MDAYLETFGTLGGPMTIAVNATGALLQLSFGDGTYPKTDAELLEHAGFRLHPASGQTRQARQEIEEYWQQQRQVFEVPVVLRGSAWQITVWQLLMKIPFGERRTYGQLAQELGRPQSARAVGRANATNNIPLVVPCHRVLGADGTLTGFAGGTHLKARLLAHESCRGAEALGS